MSQVTVVRPVSPDTDVAPITGRTRAMAAGIVGNVLEWYDFAIYAFLTPTLSKLFFPANEPSTAILLTLAVFGSGFVARPLGAILFGHLGDKYGRRAALSAVMITMGLSTFAMGLLPTHASIGVLAPVLLVVLRLLQGLSSGGEWGGSASFVVEYAPENRRGLFGSIHITGVAVGFLVGSGVVSLISKSVTPEALLEWAWRVPLLLGILVALIGFVIRVGMAETPSFQKAAAARALTETPLRAAFKDSVSAVLGVFGITVFHAVSSWVFLVYILTYLATVAKLPFASALSISLWGLIVSVILIPVFGALSDRIGRRPLLIACCVLSAIFVIPAFQAFNSGDYTAALLAHCGMIAILCLYFGPLPATLVEAFPTGVRYSGLSIAYNFAHSILGGFAPFISQYLVSVTGNVLAPTYYLIAAAAISALVLLRTKETAFQPLR